jgi:hypothetical protein
MQPLLIDPIPDQGGVATFERPTTDFLTLDEAAGVVAEAMARFDAAVSNEQGACDVGSMETMMAEARRRYEWVSGG